MKGDESMLNRFYNKTKADRKHWGRLFDHVGRLLNNSGRQLDKALTDRIISFFDWRFEVAELLEIQEFTFWLKAECLDPYWRLQSYSKILDHIQGKNVGLSRQVSTLNKLIPNHLALVVECFAKITAHMDQGALMYISAKEAKSILKAGLTDSDTKVQENSKQARENLLRLGGLEFMELD